MSLLDFINHLLGRQKPSGSLARERLQLVLAHDRSDLNPELLEQMRREILAVVQRYVEIDLDSCDVSLETDDRVTALLANLPIRRTRPQPLPAATGASLPECGDRAARASGDRAQGEDSISEDSRGDDSRGDDSSRGGQDDGERSGGDQSQGAAIATLPG